MFTWVHVKNMHTTYHSTTKTTNMAHEAYTHENKLYYVALCHVVWCGVLCCAVGPRPHHTIAHPQRTRASHPILSISWIHLLACAFVWLVDVVLCVCDDSVASLCFMFITTDSPDIVEFKLTRKTESQGTYTH